MEYIYKDDTISEITRTTKPESLMDNIKGTIFHDNYLDYLSKCYASHNGIIVKPDYIWYTILCEMAVIIKNDPETYRYIFTDSTDKKDVEVFTEHPIKMPIDKLIEKVFAMIPSDLNSKDILLKFSTTTDNSTFAFSTSFLDTASPYYNYMMFMCGYNKINVLGTTDDYQIIREAIERLYVLFSGTELSTYLDKCNALVEDIITNFDNKTFWRDIFYVEFCGSGHQEEAKGWFSELFNKYPSVGYINNFSTHKSIVEYKNISTNKSYKMINGLFSSVVDGDYLIPDFEYYIINADGTVELQAKHTIREMSR